MLIATKEKKNGQIKLPILKYHKYSKKNTQIRQKTKTFCIEQPYIVTCIEKNIINTKGKSDGSGSNYS